MRRYFDLQKKYKKILLGITLSCDFLHYFQLDSFYKFCTIERKKLFASPPQKISRILISSLIIDFSLLPVLDHFHHPHPTLLKRWDVFGLHQILDVISWHSLLILTPFDFSVILNDLKIIFLRYLRLFLSLRTNHFTYNRTIFLGDSYRGPSFNHRNTATRDDAFLLKEHWCFKLNSLNLQEINTLYCIYVIYTTATEKRSSSIIRTEIK